jgi:hypothetical protein
MDVGQTWQTTIWSRKAWNSTGVEIRRGGFYHLVATGSWRDWNIECDPDGYTSPNLLLRLAEGRRRCPPANWFELVGSVNRRRDTYFRIGTGRDYHATHDGELECFANDVRIMYFNNRGAVNLAVSRLG